MFLPPYQGTNYPHPNLPPLRGKELHGLNDMLLDKL